MARIIKGLLSHMFSDEFAAAFFNIFYFMDHYRRRFIFLSFFGLAAVFLDLASLFSIALLIDGTSDDQIQITWLSSFDNPLTGLSVNNALITIICCITILQILREALLFANEALTKKFGLDVSTRLRENIAELSLTSRYEELLKIDRGDLILYGTNFAVGIGVFTQELIRLFVNLVTIGAYTVFFIYMEPTAFSVISIIVLILIFLTNRLHLKIEKYGKHARSTEIRYYKKFQDSVSGFKDISLYNKGLIFLRDAKEISKLYKIQLWNQSLAQAMISPIQRATAFILFGMLSVIGLLIWQDENILSADRIFLILFLLLRVYGPVTQLNLIRSTLMARTGVVSIVAEFLQSYRHSIQEEHLLMRSAKDFNGQEGLAKKPLSIELEKVDYLYDTSNVPTLQNISLTLNSGETIALVGPSGAGKSTLADITIGLREPSNGFIKWQATPDSKTRPTIATIHQRGHIFYGTIAQNITMFEPDYAEEDILDAIQKAGLSGFVESLPDKANTLIGGPDNPISGGQSQRIQIARALFIKPDLLVLDEATSSQDSLGEEALLKTLQTHFKQSTIIMIAHRFSALRTANRILVMEKGKIVEEGSWDELSARDGLFKKLKEAQDMKNFST